MKSRLHGDMRRLFIWLAIFIAISVVKIITKDEVNCVACYWVVNSKLLIVKGK